MSSENDLFAKMDALLRKHRPGPLPATAAAPSAAGAEAPIPTLTDIAAEPAGEDLSLPVLTEIVEEPTLPPRAADAAPSPEVEPVQEGNVPAVYAESLAEIATTGAETEILLEAPAAPQAEVAEAAARPWIFELAEPEGEPPAGEHFAEAGGETAGQTFPATQEPHPAEAVPSAVAAPVRAAIESALVAELSAQLTKALQEAVEKLAPQIESQVREAVARELHKQDIASADSLPAGDHPCSAA